jgi:hypothetical protein
MITREELKKEYLDWVNNYLTPEKFSEHRGLTLEEGLKLIELSRSTFENNHPDE